MKVTGFLATLLVAAIVAAPAARSDNMDDIDCASSSFAFAGDGYHLDCQRSSDQVRAGESTGTTQVDLMTISSDNQHMFMTMIGIRVTAPRIYMEHRSLKSSFQDTFERVEVQDWKDMGRKNGYDSAEFTAVISGLPSSCVALQRYANPAWTGFKRHVIGMGCSTDNRESVYAALAKLHAPGD
ncbi:MAG: hypothetical protein R3D05_20525 [Dongiaceae bacterium]